jgi:hypothetical protein
MMQIAKQQVASMLQNLPEDCSLEDIQYHLYVIEKIKNGVARSETDGAISQEIAEQSLAKWMSPDWHGEALALRARSVADGNSTFRHWETEKARIRTHLTQT